MNVAIAQLNPVVGDIEGNTRKLLRSIDDAAARGADLVVAPELTVIGYPPKDLLLKAGIIERNLRAVDQAAKAARAGGIAVIVGFALPREQSRGKPLQNTAILLEPDGRRSVRAKHLLPTYDVFDEHRYFEPCPRGPAELVSFAPAGGDMGLSICEDLWNYADPHGRYPYEDNPIEAIAQAGAKLLVNISASPFSIGKQAYRMRIFGEQAARYGLPIVYVNQVGGNDDLVFDGGSAVIDANGKLIAQSPAFREDLRVVDLDAGGERLIVAYPDDLDSVYEALVLGTRDYVGKCGFDAAVVGLSGGIDSAVTAAIAVAALGPDRVHGVAMPSRFSSDHSIADARALADHLGIDLAVIPIERIHAATESELAPYFQNGTPGVAEENIQARIRGNILMGLSNKHGWLLLTTGNKSELAVGYCTLYGDMCGGLAVISDVPKTMVYRLAERINERAGRELIPINTIRKPPSAELREAQTDQDTLPPYDVLDDILRRYIECEEPVDGIIAAGLDADTVHGVVRMVDRNEHKRKQSAVGLKVTSRAFGTGRRMPIAARYSAAQS